jgi:undecaprenyl-phosphate galactose phosphotransferase
MSIVGPRPLVEGELEAHGGSKLYWKVKPGITGWWASHGRSDVDYDERLKMEYFYVRNLSLKLDVICIYKTIIAVIKHKGVE